MPYGHNDPKKIAFKRLIDENVQAICVLVDQSEIARYSNPNLMEDYRNAGIDVLYHPTQDYGTWPVNTYGDVIAEIVKRVLDGQTVAVHCHYGIGRAGTILTGVLSELNQITVDDAAFSLAKLGIGSEAQGQRDVVQSWDRRRTTGNK